MDFANGAAGGASAGLPSSARGCLAGGIGSVPICFSLDAVLVGVVVRGSEGTGGGGGRLDVPSSRVLETFLDDCLDEGFDSRPFRALELEPIM